MTDILFILVIVLTQISIWSYVNVARREMDLFGKTWSRLIVAPFLLNVISYLSLYFLVDMNKFLLFVIYFIISSTLIKYVIDLLYEVIFKAQILINGHKIFKVSTICAVLSIILFVIGIVL